MTSPSADFAHIGNTEVIEELLQQWESDPRR